MKIAALLVVFFFVPVAALCQSYNELSPAKYNQAEQNYLKRINSEAT